MGNLRYAPRHGEIHRCVDQLTPVLARIQKIISTLLKELDAFARNGIKDELASLDPLLRNMAVADNRREQYDFEGVV